MSSERKISANRRNANRSTGPRTDAGKCRSCKNALSHGLAVPIHTSIEYTREIDALAVHLAGGGQPNEEKLARARLVAEAEIDLRRARAAKLMLLASALSVPEPAKRKDQSRLRPYPASRITPISQAQLLVSREWLRLDRYERRARSRRSAALREFDP